MVESSRTTSEYGQARKRSESRSKKTARKSSRTKRARRQSTDQSAPPVMFRGSLAGFTWNTAKRKKSKPRRRYDLTLNVPGAEMRLPAVPQVAFGWRLVSGVLALALVMLIYHLWTGPMYQIQQLQIHGLQRLDSRDVTAILGLTGGQIFTVNADELESRLRKTFPEFTEVSVEVGLPASVIVSVQERQPIVTWQQDGRTILVDPDGMAFPRRSESDATPALVVNALDSPPAMQQTEEAVDGAVSFLPVEMVSALLSMNAQAPEGSMLVYDKLRGLGWKDVQGWEVYFGDVRDMSAKLNVYRVIVDKLAKENISPALISVEHVHNPYYRLER